MSDKLTFTECELVIDDSSIPEINVFQNISKDIYENEGFSYDINCEIIDNKIFWIYAEYGKEKPYTNKLLNVETKEYSQNKRNPNEAELRNQLFCMYIPYNAILYMSDFRKSRFLESYLKYKFNRNFIIKKYFAEPKTFVEEINAVKSLKFVFMDKEFFNVGVFENVKDVCGYGNDIYNLTIEFKVKDYKFNPKKCLDFLIKSKDKKYRGEIDRMICVGKDDKGVEKIFNLDTYLKKIKIPIQKDENEMYDAEIIKKYLLEQLNA